MEEYTFSMSDKDQNILINVGKECKYGEMLQAIRKASQGSAASINVDFKEQSTSKFVLSHIDRKMMKETINNFPVELALNSRKLYSTAQLQTIFEVDPERIYDVRFLIPLLYHAVSPSLFVDCRDFIARRCLALTLTGLSSEDSQMRALCYKILERYYDHLLSALLIDKQLWVNFLDLIRNSISTPNFRLKFLFTTFLCKVIDVLLHPDKDKMYELIKEFLAGKPRLHVDTIEIYDDLLFCSDLEHYDNNLRWLITLFRDGLQTSHDIKMMTSLNVIAQAMCLYNSTLRFKRANEAICSMFIRMVKIPEGAQILISEYSFLPWLHQMILHHLAQKPQEFKDDSKSESMNDIIKSVSSLVFGLVDALLKGKDANSMPIRRVLELINVFLALHDLIIKSKNAPVLEYYLNYVRKVSKSIRKNKNISDEMSAHLLGLMKLKMPYLIQ